MKEQTKKLLESAYQYCEERDKSNEFMLEYLQDVANVDLDCVLRFLTLKTKDNKLWNISVCDCESILGSTQKQDGNYYCDICGKKV